jgi:hypothetical protein
VAGEAGCEGRGATRPPEPDFGTARPAAEFHFLVVPTYLRRKPNELPGGISGNAGGKITSSASSGDRRIASTYTM